MLTDWDQFSRELGLDEDMLDAGAGEADVVPADSDGDRVELQRVRQQLLAFGMAVVAMGYLPRLPSKQVTFPQNYGKPPTYADIPVPHTAGELLWRIEELEETVWQMMSRDLGELVQRRYGPVRRTYGFFETSAWLSSREVERFGLKRNDSRPEAVLGESRCAEARLFTRRIQQAFTSHQKERLTGSFSGQAVRWSAHVSSMQAGG